MLSSLCMSKSLGILSILARNSFIVIAYLVDLYKRPFLNNILLKTASTEQGLLASTNHLEAHSTANDFFLLLECIPFSSLISTPHTFLNFPFTGRYIVHCESSTLARFALHILHSTLSLLKLFIVLCVVLSVDYHFL